MRITKITFLALFLFLLLPLQGDTASCDNLPKGAIQLSVYIPGVTSGGEGCYYLQGGLPEYIKVLYNFALATGGFLAMFMVMVGGAQWVTAGGAADKITRAKERIMNAVAGLILLLLSFSILYIINPDLLKFKTLNPEAYTKKAGIRMQSPTQSRLQEAPPPQRSQRPGGPAVPNWNIPD